MTVWRDNKDGVTAHFNRHKRELELAVYCTMPLTWQPADVERDLFEKLHAAHFNIEPKHRWGFLQRLVAEAHDFNDKYSIEVLGQIKISHSLPVRYIAQHVNSDPMISDNVSKKEEAPICQEPMSDVFTELFEWASGVRIDRREQA